MRVMSFNIRNSHADDGEHRWDNRKDAVVETIRRFDPEIVGAQECRAEQIDFLREHLGDYETVGVCRDDGGREGEAASILVRRASLELLDSGTFWLSREPGRIGSVGWDANLPRICTWARVRDRSSTREMFALNTHYDHLGVAARVESSRLIARWLGEHARDLPTIVIGDFNTDAAGESYDVLLSAGLRDVYRMTHAFGGDEATFHGFTGVGRGGRIDWILCSRHFDVLACEIDRSPHAGRFASDHFPVTAELRLRR